ncbi:hypothetical protein HK096_002767 [Nowakowskiella sp. JEL0078]|nr:hypothetical protein HK096_002767 [Nowakowskiella sp. JEL0078]
MRQFSKIQPNGFARYLFFKILCAGKVWSFYVQCPSLINFSKVVVFLAVFVDVLCYSIIIPFIPFKVEQFGGDAKDTGLLLAFFALGAMVTSPLFGLWSDRMRSRKIPMLVGLAGLFLSTLFFALATSWWMLSVARVLQGVSGAATWTLGLSLLADWFPPEEIGRAMSIALSSYSVSQALGPPLGGILYQNTGYYGSFILCGVLVILDLIGRCLISDKPPNHHNVQKDMGVSHVTDNEASVELEKLDNTLVVEEVESRKQEKELSLLSLSTKSYTLIIGALTICFGSVMTSVEPTLPLFLAEPKYNMNSQTIGFVFIAIVLPTIVMGPVGGMIYDKYGFLKVTIPGIVMMILFTPLLILLDTQPESVPMLVVLLVLFSVGLTLFGASMIPELSKCVEQVSFGKIYGLYSMYFSIGTIVGPTLLGSIPYQFLGWKWQIVIATGFTLICSPLIFLYKRPQNV